MNTYSFQVHNNALEAQVNSQNYIPITPPQNYFINVASLGILPENTGSQNSDAWDAAMAALDPTNKSIGARWIFASGTYNFARTAKITRQMVIEGVTGKDSYYGTRFVFPAGVTGLLVAGTADPLGSGVHSIVRNVRLSGGGGATAHGILINRTCRIEHLFVQGFSGNGICIQADVAAGTNANGWFIQDVTSQENGGHGLYVQGPDTNSGTAIASIFISNGGWGVYESSFLGNYYYGVGTDSNALGAITTVGSTNQSLFAGCYIEANGGNTQIEAPSIFMGGINGLGTSGFTGSGVHFYGDSVLRRALKFMFNENTSSGYIAIGGDPDSTLNVLELKVPDADGGGSLYSSYTPDNAFVSKAFGLGSWGTYGYWALYLPTVYSQLAAWPMDMYYTPDFPVVPHGLFMHGTRFESVDAVPDGTTHLNRTWNQGDVAFNRVVAAGGKMGWVCVQHGTLGSYAEGRTVTADGSTTVTLSAPSTVLRVGMIVNMGSSVRNRIMAISGSTMTMAVGVPSGSNLPISYAAPTFKSWGDIEP